MPTPRFRLTTLLASLLLLVAVATVRAETRAIPLTADAWRLPPWNKAQASLLTLPDQIPPQSAARNAGALGVHVLWPSGGEFRFVSLTPAAALEPVSFRATEVRVWVWGSNTKHYLEANFADADAKDAKVGLGMLNFTGWRQLRAKVPETLKQPLTLTSLTLHNWDQRDAAEIRILLHDLEIAGTDERLGAPAVAAPKPPALPPAPKADDTPTLAFDPDTPNGLTPADRASTTVRLDTWPGKGATWTVRVRGVDWSGVERVKRDLTADVRGAWAEPVAVDLPRFGPVTLTAELIAASGGQPVRTASTRLIRHVSPPKLTAEERRTSWIGVNTHYLPPWESLGALGIHWARDYSWGWLEYGEKAPTAGNGVPFAPVWEKARAAGVTVLPVLARAYYNPEKTGWITDSRVSDAYERLAHAFPEIVYWEIDNEPEYGFVTGKVDPTNYRQYIRAAAEGLRRAGGRKLVLAGTAGMQVAETRELLRAEGVSPVVRGDFDVVNYHYYTGGLPVETARTNTNETGPAASSGTLLETQRMLNELARAAGKEAWLTEIGWDVTNGNAVGERLQAIYLPRVFLLSRLVGTDKVFWYFDRDVAGSVQRYSTMGLFDTAWTARPSAAALAALSAHVARATSLGSIDLGDDRWCVVLRRPDGEYVAAAWSVERRHPLPKELAGAAAFDLFGNAAKPTELSPEVTYFRLKALPVSWAGQLRADVLTTTVRSVAPGGVAPIRLSAPGATMAWEKLPASVTGGAWTADGDTRASSLRLAADYAGAPVTAVAVARGAGWERRWRIALQPGPAANAKVAPYLPGQPVDGEIRPLGEAPRRVTLALPAGAGTVEPMTGEATLDKPFRFRLTAGADRVGALPLSLTLDDGSRMTITVPPAQIDVPTAGAIVADGRLNDWPGDPVLPTGYFAGETGHEPQARFAWSPAGLWVGVRMRVDPAVPRSPRDFWDWSGFELFVDRGTGAATGWPQTSHQFYFVPVPEGNAWRLAAGEYKRHDGIKQTTYDDPRIRTAARRDNGFLVMEALIPADALGAVPQGGDTWRLALSVRAVAAGTPAVEASWPRTKGDGLLAGSAAWGVIRLR